MASQKPKTNKNFVRVGLILLVFLGYLAWVQRDIHTPPPPVIVEDHVVPPSPEGQDFNTPYTPVELPEPLSRPSVQAQLAQAPDLSSPRFTQELVNIRRMIEEEKILLAEVNLKALPHKVTKDPDTRLIVATLWNNLGVLKSRKQGQAASIPAYKAGLALNPESPVLNLNLAHAYWETEDSALTVEFLEHLVELLPSTPFPHLALADKLYAREDLVGAAEHLEKATQLSKGKPELQSYLRYVIAKVNQAETTERGFLRRESSHFVVKFDGKEDYEIWHEVLGILEDGYRDIGQKFEYFPDQPIHVVLLTKQQFSSVTGSPAWADGLFDGVLGRIKIPTQGALTDREWLSRVLRHEFVHALIHQRMGVQSGSVPQWLNEGLAMYLAGDNWPDIDEIAMGPNLRLIPLQALHGGWGGYGYEAALVAYLEGHSATRYMVDRFGMHKVNQILDQLKAGQTMEGAMQDKLMMSYDTFQNRWTNHLLEKMTAGQFPPHPNQIHLTSEAASARF